MSIEQKQEPEVTALVEAQRKFFEFKTIPEKLHLDWEAEVLKDESMIESAANLLNWEFKEKYCNNLPEEWWFHSDREGMYIMLSDFWRIAFVLPHVLEFSETCPDECCFGFTEAENIRTMKVGIFKTRGPSAFGLLNAMEHPSIKWIREKIKLLEDSGVPENVTDQFGLNILLITALYHLLKNREAVLPPHLKGDFIALNDSLLKFERF